MRKLFTAAFAIVLVTTLISGPVWAKSDWDFQLYRTRKINGTQLEHGSYVLRLNGNNEAEIYRKRRAISGQESNGKLITKVPVEVRPLEIGVLPKSIVVMAGVFIQILMKKVVVVFPSTPRS